MNREAGAARNFKWRVLPGGFKYGSFPFADVF